jgi:valyl-tRNA synthetase
VLQRVLDHSLRLLHPYIPFVTEETWQQMREAFLAANLDIAPDEGWAEALIIADWPTAVHTYPEGAADYERLRDLVREIRAARSDNQVEPARKIGAIVAAGEKTAVFQAQRATLAFLARLNDDRLHIVAEADAPDAVVTLALGDVTCYLPLAGMVDLDKEKARLEQELATLGKEIQRLTGLLNSSFAEKAPTAVVQKERDKLAQLQASQTELKDRLASLA